MLDINTFSLGVIFPLAKKDLSNFKTSKGTSLNKFNEEYPVPKSSIDNTNPMALNSEIVSK